MPLPSVLNGAKQCQVLTKRTKQRCNNPAAFGCKVCRLHGAHKSRHVLKGADHPQYKDGNRTIESQKANSADLTRLRMLEQIGWHINMFNGGKTRGRKPNGYMKLNLDDPLQMAIAILMTQEK
jgi:hypothetical protein